MSSDTPQMTSWHHDIRDMSTPGQAATRAPVPLRQVKLSEMIEDQTNKFFEMETINYSNCYQNHIVSIEFYKTVKLRVKSQV